MSFYGMNDFPDGKIIRNSFINENGKVLDKGDIYNLNIPWGFMNPFLEKDLYENNFYDKENKFYKKEIDISKLQELVGKNKEELEDIPLLKKWLKTHNIEELIKSKNKIRQSYMFMSLTNDDYLVIRGKKNDLPEAYVFQVKQPGVLKYTNNYRPYMTFKVICKVPNEVYKKLEARRASMWKLLERDFREIEKLV